MEVEQYSVSEEFAISSYSEVPKLTAVYKPMIFPLYSIKQVTATRRNKYGVTIVAGHFISSSISQTRPLKVGIHQSTVSTVGQQILGFLTTV